MTFEHDKLHKSKSDFPILEETINNRPLIYLDNAASTQKPRAVIDIISSVYEKNYSNVHRGVHTLSQRCTDLFEDSREKARAFINAQHAREIIFVRGTTEAINLVAQSYGRANIAKDDEILITAMEHHSNIVPWQLLCAQTGSRLVVAPMSPSGELIMDDLKSLISARTRIVAITHMSNALGTINPVEEIIRLAHNSQIPVLLDGAQAAPHLSVDVQKLDCDFYCFSGHKIYGPSGIGILYGKEDILNKMPPYQGGGDMIRSVTFEKSEFNTLPYKFEAGTPNIADAIGLGAAIDYVNSIGIDLIAQHEHNLLSYATEKALELNGLRILGTSPNKGAILSFTLEGIHPHDIGTMLDFQGIAIRAGHHCAMPVMDYFKVPATARASFGLYNTINDVDVFIEGLKEVVKMFH
jgi:cysteine desulfurase/selenocysteine lyase